MRMPDKYEVVDLFMIALLIGISVWGCWTA